MARSVGLRPLDTRVPVSDAYAGETRFNKLRLWLAKAVVVLITLFVVALMTGPQDGSDVTLTSTIGNALNLAISALAWLAVARARTHRLEIALGASAVTAFAFGDLYYVLALGGSDAVGYNVVADLAYLAFYPLIIAALTLVVVRYTRRAHWPVLLDGIVCALGSTSAMMVVLTPLMNTSSTQFTLESAIAVSYTWLDVAAVALMAGVLGCRGAYLGKRWPFLVVGLIIFSVADVLYALNLNSYVLGTPLDAGWAVGMALITVWLDAAAKPDTRVVTGVPALIVPLAATGGALGVLVIGNVSDIPAAAVVLSACTLALATMPLIFRHRLLHSMARTDELTGLPNRRALHADAPRLLDGGDQGSILLLDLDRFKNVNDGLGHEAGDLLLQQVSGRLRALLRPSDLLVRLGGDEFAVVLPKVDRNAALATAGRIRDEISRPFQLGATLLQTSASVGVALFPIHGSDLRVVLRRADVAMFRAKADHSGTHVYGSEDHDDGAARLRSVEELRTALTNDELLLHYQPKIDLLTASVTGVEALVRWNHPARGLLFPDAFLHLAEEAGLMSTLTEVVLRKAMDQMVAWRGTGISLSVAVNLSPTCIDDHLPQRVTSMLTERALAPSTLVLEITEQMLMKDGGRTAAVLRQLRAEGIRVSIDDFGTGYSSLAYLRDLPVDELKLDRAFLTHVHDDKRAADLVSFIIGLAHSLGLEIVAEGVETSADYNMLARQGCDTMQGYHISPPVSAPDLARWLANPGLAGRTPESSHGRVNGMNSPTQSTFLERGAAGSLGSGGSHRVQAENQPAEDL
ncbi:putative bifunctional diguanylate cyclase/phosphodiesterase [Arthrobacter sp. CAN_A1]|uniref:putative bifunctional diguanylate cyclase/phosphodiesterase n=1 Tax=Arthrobacter sp. CAN_A1 TaxID=2787717 RepID=UPI0018C9EA65